MKNIIVVLIALCLTSCYSTAEYIRGPDGHYWVSITCNRSQSNCFERASDECPNGYVVASSEERQSQFTYVNQYSGYSVPIYKGELFIKCK